MTYNFFPLSFIVILFVWSMSLTTPSKANKQLDVVILEETQHDTRTFTQGLFWQNGKIYESSGLYRKSYLRSYDAKTNHIEHHTPLPSNVFAEGLTLYKDQLYLLTWRAGRLLVFDSNSLHLEKELKYSGEGWGLTHSDKHFIMSDGSENLYFRDPQTFDVVRKIQVHNQWRKHNKLNELEYAEGAIWANVWQAPYILKISPGNGEVLGIASLQTLVEKNSKLPSHSVLNGIAYDKTKNAFWVTGKLWPKRYLIRFKTKANNGQ